MIQGKPKCSQMLNTHDAKGRGYGGKNGGTVTDRTAGEKGKRRRIRNGNSGSRRGPSLALCSRGEKAVATPDRYAVGKQNTRARERRVGSASTGTQTSQLCKPQTHPLVRAPQRLSGPVPWATCHARHSLPPLQSHPPSRPPLRCPNHIFH